MGLARFKSGVYVSWHNGSLLRIWTLGGGEGGFPLHLFADTSTKTTLNVILTLILIILLAFFILVSFIFPPTLATGGAWFVFGTRT